MEGDDISMADGNATAEASERVWLLCDERGFPPTPEEMHEALASPEGDQAIRVKSEEFCLAALRFRRALGAETDRGAALFAAAFLDARLEALLRRYFVQRDDVASNLLRGTGGLSTFSARIDLAMLLGLVSSSTWRDLHLLRRIRNDFAHNSDAIDFSHGPIASRCRELGHTPLVEGDKPRTRYVQAAMGVAGEVDTVLSALSDGSLAVCSEAKDHALEPAKMREVHVAHLRRLAEVLERNRR